MTIVPTLLVFQAIGLELYFDHNVVTLKLILAQEPYSLWSEVHTVHCSCGS